MTNFPHRVADNVPRKFYVTWQCLDCDLCRATAPDNFARNDEGGYSYVKKQPENEEELKLCSESVFGCCTQAIETDGDEQDWSEPINHDALFADDSSVARNPCCYAKTEKRVWWKSFWPW